ncbi:Periplasmic copper-binding protein (NosD) [uncultured archaeon]|nr:Periplasmic copper-binding protein (NosD) [uncultured archaeon]
MFFVDMRFAIILGLIVFACFSAGVSAYDVIGGGVCDCGNCSDCNSALNDNENCTTVRLSSDVSSPTSSCINNPDNFNNKVFDCMNHWINGSGQYHGVYAYAKENVTIQNCEVTNFWNGLNLYFPRGFIVRNNTLVENNRYDLRVWADGKEQCMFVMENNMGPEGRPILVYNSSFSLANAVASQLVLCAADNSSVVNVTVVGSSSLDNNGIDVFVTDDSNFTDVNSSDNYYGIYFLRSNNNRVEGSIFNSNLWDGVYLWDAPTIISDNTMLYNGRYDLGGTIGTTCNSVVTGNTGTGGLPIRFVNSAETVSDEVVSELILCQADDAVVRNVTLANVSGIKNNGVLMLNTNRANITDVTSSSHYHGFNLDYCADNVFLRPTANGNDNDGFYFGSSVRNRVLNGTLVSNTRAGISLTQSNYNNLSYNLVHFGWWGVYEYLSSNNTVEQNNVSATSNMGVYLTSSPDGLVVGNTVNDGDQGIYVLNSDGVSVVNNTVNSNGFRGISASGSDVVFNGNTACGNINSDFYSSDWGASSGDGNRCSLPDGWNDSGTSGCTYSCQESLVHLLYGGWNLLSLRLIA